MADVREELQPLVEKLGIGAFHRHVFLCVGGSCAEPTVGEAAWEALKKLLSETIKTRAASNLVQARAFSDMLDQTLRRYHNRSLDELPSSAEELQKLARRIGIEPGLGEDLGQRFLQEMDRHTAQTRQLFLEIVVPLRNKSSQKVGPNPFPRRFTLDKDAIRGALFAPRAHRVFR